MACSICFNSHTISRLDATSCTDMGMKWKKKDGKALYEGRPVTDMCHVPASEPITVQKRGAAFHEMLSILPDCMLASHLRHAQAAMTQAGPPRAGEELLFRTIVGNSMQLDADLVQDLEPVGVSGALATLYDRYCVGESGSLSILKEFQGSPRWATEREKRITGSTCYGLYTYAKNRGVEPEEWQGKLSTMAKPFRGNQATSYGKRCEKLALSLYSESVQDSSAQVVQCGLVVPPNCPWIGVSPDAILFKDGKPHRLVEIKSPTAGAKLSASELLTQGKTQYVVFDGENGYLKPRHPYYGQVQLGMAVLTVSACDFVVYGKESLAIIKVPRDDAFISDMLRVLHSVFFRVMLPFHAAKLVQ